MENEKNGKWKWKNTKKGKIRPLLIALGTILPLPHIPPPPSQSGILISSRKIFLFRCFVLNAEINERNVTEIHRGQVTLRFTVSSNAGDSLGSLTACSINN